MLKQTNTHTTHTDAHTERIYSTRVFKYSIVAFPKNATIIASKVVVHNTFIRVFLFKSYNTCLTQMRYTIESYNASLTKN